MSLVPKKLTCIEPATEAPIKFIRLDEDDVSSMVFFEGGVTVVRNERTFLIPWSNIAYVEAVDEKKDVKKS